MSTNHSACENCNNSTSPEILQIAIAELGHALCRSCLANHKMKIESSTWEAINLYLSLKKRGVPAALDKFEQADNPAFEQDRVAIAVEAIADKQIVHSKNEAAKATHQSFRKGLLTVRIPNTMVTADEGTADYITRFLQGNKEQQGL